MFNFKEIFLNKFFGFIAIFSLLRIYLEMNLPIWFFKNAVYDDVLLLNYSHLNQHFHQWYVQSLSKDMGYPLFLFFVRLTHMPYRFWLAILWILAAIIVIYAVNTFLTKNKKVLCFAYIFILFSPVAFDVICGQRIYRNAIMMPFTVIFLSSLYIFINNLLINSNKRELIFWGILTGLVFTFNYYIKEDGIITLPILIVSIVSILLFKLHEEKKLSFTKKYVKLSSICAICLIPIIIFGGCTIFYEEVNYHYFGVHEINTRTSGQLGNFYNNLLLIDDDSKTNEIWVTNSTVEKAWNASPTLQKHPELLDAYLNTEWNGILKNSTIKGDLVAWSLRKAIDDVNLYNNEKEVNDLFFKVNNELDASFEKGTLNKSDKIFITSSASGKSIEEIFDLKPLISSGLKIALFYNGIEVNTIPLDERSSFNSSEKIVKHTENDLNDNIITQSEFNNFSLIQKMPIKLIELDIIIYQIISFILIPFTIISFIILCLNQSKNKFKNRTLNALILYDVLLIGTFLIQVFAIAWFCSYLGTNPWIGTLNDIIGHIKFHLASSYGFLAMFIILNISTAYAITKDNYSKS